jgi:hypothetical protein
MYSNPLVTSVKLATKRVGVSVIQFAAHDVNLREHDCPATHACQPQLVEDLPDRVKVVAVVSTARTTAITGRFICDCASVHTHRQIVAAFARSSGLVGAQETLSVSFYHQVARKTSDRPHLIEHGG